MCSSFLMEKLEIYSSLLSLLLLAREQISIRRDDLIPMVEELLYYAKVFKGIGCCWWVTAWIIHGSSIKIKEDSVRLIAYRKRVMQRPKSSFMKFYLTTWLSLCKNSFHREWTSLDYRGIKKKKLGQGRINVVTCSRKLSHCFLFPSAIPRTNNSKEKDSMVYGGFICVSTKFKTAMIQGRI